MSTKQKKSHIEQQASDQGLIDGLTKNAQTLTSFLLEGTTIKASDAIATLEARIAAANTVQSTRATWQAAVKANATEHASTQTLVSGLTQALKLMFAGSIESLAEFGLKPRKVRAIPSPETQVVAAAKAKATRSARHTMGSKQKKKVSGTITTIVAAPTSSAASPRT